MFGIILSAFILLFGIFLMFTKNTGFVQYKRFSWIFIVLGIITLAGKIVIGIQKGGF